MTHAPQTTLAHEAAGAGDPPLLLIHGWATDRRIFGPVQRALCDNHRVVAVDLRGHGASDPRLHEGSVEAHADDLAGLATQLGLDRPVVLGHSFGGLVALEYASRFATRAAILLESPIAAPPTMAAALQPALIRLETDAYQATAAAIFAGMLGPHFDPEGRATLLAYVRSLPQPVLLRTLQAALAYDAAGAAARVQCPLLYVGTAAPFADLGRFRELCPQLITGQLVGCGHYFPLEVPDQLIPMLRRFLAVCVA